MKNNFIKKIDKAIINQTLENDFTAIDAELESLGYNIDEINDFSEKMCKRLKERNFLSLKKYLNLKIKK